MPTAARLTAAACLALLAFIVSGQIIDIYPEGKDFGWFTPVNMAIGAVVGWIVMGKRAGRGFVWGINNGFTGVLAVLFWALFIQGGYEMTRLAMRHRFDGPMEAIIGIFDLGLGYAQVILTPLTIGTMVVGALVSGLATEYAKRRWK